MTRARAPLTGAYRAERKGTALVAVLAALVVASLAATAAVSLSRTLQQDARGTVAVLRARTAAEGALAATLGNWPVVWTTALVPGSSDTRAVTSPAGAATVRALRLDSRRYFLTAEAASAALVGRVGPAVRRVGVFTQLDLTYEAPAALVAAVPITLAIESEVRAADAPPAGWTDCTAAPEMPPVAAVAAPSVKLATTARVLGPVLTAPSAWAPPVPERFGDVDRAALAARADIVVPAGGLIIPVPRAASGSPPVCVRDRTSWGDPWRGATAVPGCTDDYPVVYLQGAGTTMLHGPGRLQGTLLVDGSLNVVGRVEVAGLVVINGALQASLGELIVDGAVLVRGSSASLGASSRVRRSRCALDRAAAAAARPVPLARRAWVDVVR